MNVKDTEYQTHVVPVGEMSTIWETETHEAVLRLDQRCQGRKAASHVQNSTDKRNEKANFAVDPE